MRMWGEILDSAPAPPPPPSADPADFRRWLLDSVVSSVVAADEKDQHSSASESVLLSSSCTSSATDCLFGSRQRDAPPLSRDDRHRFAAELIDRSPADFLARFARFITDEEQLAFFRSAAFADDFEVAFRVRQIERQNCKFAANVLVRNRRYRALRQMLEAGDDYFSEAAMSARQPQLYHELVERHKTGEEREVDARGDFDRANCRLSTIILEHMDLNAERDRRAERASRTDDAEEEEVDTDDEDDSHDGSAAEACDASARRELREEFVSAAYRSFLEGRDAGFDYAAVDQSAAYDDIDVIERDIEDQYFDNEEADDAGNDDSRSALAEGEYDY